MTTKFGSRFIKVHAISTTPGNEVHEYWHRADIIYGVGEAPSQHAVIGAGAVIDISGDTHMYVKESAEEVMELLNQIDLLP